MLSALCCALFVCYLFFAKPFLLCFSLSSSVIFLFISYFSSLNVFSFCELTYISNVYITCVETNSKTSRFIWALGQRGEGNSIVFHLSFLTQPPPATMTSHSNGQEPLVACAN